MFCESKPGVIKPEGNPVTALVAGRKRSRRRRISTTAKLSYTKPAAAVDAGGSTRYLRSAERGLPLVFAVCLAIATDALRLAMYVDNPLFSAPVAGQRVVADLRYPIRFPCHRIYGDIVHISRGDEVIQRLREFFFVGRKLVYYVPHRLQVLLQQRFAGLVAKLLIADHADAGQDDQDRHNDDEFQQR